MADLARRFVHRGALASAAVIVLAATLAMDVDPVWAENECGPHEAGVEIVCSSSNYDPSEGNIFYGGREESGDFTIRLNEDVSVRYDRDAPGDDVYVFSEPAGLQGSSAVSIWPGEIGTHIGDISLFSSADVTSNGGGGIWVGHYGQSGAIRMDISGGEITTTGDSSPGIRGFYHQGVGGIDLVARGVTVTTAGNFAYGISSFHIGEGALNLTARDLAIDTAGASAYSVSSRHLGTGALNLSAQGLAIDTAGELSHGVYGLHQGEGDVSVDVQGGSVSTEGHTANGVDGRHHGEGDLSVSARDLAIDTAGNHSKGVFGWHTSVGDLSLDVQGGSVSTEGVIASGVYGRHHGEGDVSVDVQGGSVSTEGRDANGVFGRHTDTGDVSVSARDFAIDTAGNNSRGVVGLHLGEGNLNLDAQGLAIETAGKVAHGVYGLHFGAGDVNVSTRETTIYTVGETAHGVYGIYQGEGGLNLTARDLAVATGGQSAHGVYGWHHGEGGVSVDVQGGSVSTEGLDANGVVGRHQGTGDVSVSTRETTIYTVGETAHGVYGIHQREGGLNLTARDLAVATTGAGGHGVFGIHHGEGGVSVDVQGGSVSTEGLDANGVVGRHQGTGDVSVSARDLAIDTAGDNSRGVFGLHQGEGDLNLDAQGLAIETAGELSHGVYGLHFGAGDVNVSTRETTIYTVGETAHGVYGIYQGEGDVSVSVRETTIATTGEAAHGVLSWHTGTARITVEGGSIHASGEDASGIRFGQVNEDGVVEDAAPVGEDGYRKQSVTVNAPVTGGSGEGAAGVFLSGGGKVVIGPEGTLGAASGIAILAKGGSPRLRVDTNLDGRRLEQVFGDSRIINDGGETTLLLNGVVMHEGATGATGAEVANGGAWDVTLSASGAIGDRQVFQFIETYAPRAAVYEALPGFLLRLEAVGRSEERITSPDSSVWARISGGLGSYEPRHASVGATYDLRRYRVEVGMDVSLGESVTGSVSLHHARGSAEVESPYGGGQAEATGLGIGVGVSWSGAGAYYGRGRLVLADYDVDVSSDKRGSLAQDVGVKVNSLDFEAGRRIAIDSNVVLTPRAWASRRWLSSAAFTDAVNASVSLNESARFTGGLGLAAETVRPLASGMLSLRASADVARVLSGADTSATISGENLVSESQETKVLLGLGGMYRRGEYSLGAQLVADGLGSSDEQYLGQISFRWRF